MYDPILDPQRPETWLSLDQLNSRSKKTWIKNNFKPLIATMQKQPVDGFKVWNKIGFLCIDLNLYREAEVLYQALFKKAKDKRANFAVPAYYRGIAKFLQGRHREAFDDFKLARQHDLMVKNFHGPSAQAINYMEETLFPTKEMIIKNQHKLTKDLNTPRMLDKVMGPGVLRTIHKWNSATPLFSSGISQGGGYFLTLKNAHGETKGIAVDPGYDFYDIFRDIGLSLSDIDAIIMTHDHDDHTEAVEGILSLLAKYNDYSRQKSKVIDIFGSAGTLLKYHGLLSATDPTGNREINFKLLVPGNEITTIDGSTMMEKYGFTISVNPAYHKELWTSQESSVGMVLNTHIKDSKGEPLKIGITGDSRYETGLGLAYRGCQVILLNIGSVEKEEGKLLSQHLGINGCINLLKEARLGKPCLAILTEFGEEFSGKRETISKILENWAKPVESERASNDFRVIPADVHLEVRLKDLNVRESDTRVFFPYNMIKVDESDPEILAYRFNG